MWWPFKHNTKPCLALFSETEANYISAKIGHGHGHQFLKAIKPKACMYSPHLIGATTQKSPALAQQKPNLSIYIPFFQNFINHLIF